MKKIDFFFLLLPAVYGHLVLKPATFTQYYVWKTWADAQAICRRNNTEMVTIYDEQENDFFRKGGGWIGLYKEDGSQAWKWSENNQMTNYKKWRTYWEPLYDCALKYRNESLWRTDDCNNPNLFMCYERLLLIKENKTWEEALEHCRSLGDREGWNHSYDLATLMTEDDITYARQKAQAASSTEVWIGLRFLGNSWIWAGGEQVVNLDFPSCQALRCGVLKSSGVSLEIRDCSERRNFFCYRNS